MQDEEEVLDFTKLRYGLYVRKSTDDKERQQRSTDDQIAECEEMAAKMGLHLIRPYYEDKASAKIPNNPKRDRFKDLLADLRSGKLDGIMAWHPDRLARNMEDGGVIFGLIDQDILKDLKFVTHYYTNDASGKMLLGISFTLATYYSANLSQSVKRGQSRGFKEGKSTGTPKHGYIYTEQGTYMPDGKNFDLISEAWQMRVRGISLQDITNYLNENGYARVIKSTKSKRHGEKIKMSFQILSELFKDTFYYGRLQQNKKAIDLRGVYNFEPAVTEDDYNEVQRLARATVSPIVTNRRKTYYPLRGMVKCSFCGRSMSPGASMSQHGDRLRYLYYRCTNEVCPRKKKSIRAITVFKFIYDLFENGVELTQDDYKYYYEHLTSAADQRHLKLVTEINSKRGAIKATNRRAKSIGLKIIDYSKNSSIWKINNDQLEKLDNERGALEDQIIELTDALSDPEQELLSIEQFLNLAKTAGSKVRAADEVGKDHICRIILLNLVVDEEKVVDYHLTQAFSKLKNIQSFRDGQGERI